jgi:hypothetical protein
MATTREPASPRHTTAEISKNCNGRARRPAYDARMKTIMTLACAAALVASSGCSSTSPAPEPRLEDAPDVMTGSNIPRRDPSSRGVQTFDKDAVQDLLRTPSPVRPPGG